MENELINIYIKNILHELTETQKKLLVVQSQLELQNLNAEKLSLEIERLDNENSILKKRKSNKAAEE